MSALRMEAEIVCADPDPIIAKLRELAELEFEIELIDWEGEDCTTIVATTFTDLEPEAFFHLMDGLVDQPFDFVMHVEVIERPDLVRDPAATARPHLILEVSRRSGTRFCSDHCRQRAHQARIGVTLA